MTVVSVGAMGTTPARAPLKDEYRVIVWNLEMSVQWPLGAFFSGELMSTTIQTELGYLIPSTDKPIYIASEGGANARLDISAKFASHAVTILDAREKKPAPTLDREGFGLVRHDTLVSDFYDDVEVSEVYERETRDLVLHATGASHVVV
ncbi:MAG: hypothetical protein ACE5FA_14395, partial [Dehalococcoidia bacterium]